MSETIYALSTASGRAGVAVIRVSGPAVRTVLAEVAGLDAPKPRSAQLRKFRAADGSVIDEGLVLFFPAPHSFTGEDVAEFQGHGGRAVVTAMLDRLSAMDGLRLADAGEFSRRAFDNGHFDLAEIEGLADLIDAETEAQRVQALRQMGGGLSDLVEGWRARLVRALAHLEADIDFPDEDLPDGVAAQMMPQIAALQEEITAHLADKRGERVRDGLSIAVLGAPNAGKSSIINRLVEREAVIVSDIAGTTRDVVELHLDIGGYPVTVADTAGLRESVDVIEQEGVRRARKKASMADLVLFVVDGTEDEAGEIPENALIWVNKADLIADDKLRAWRERLPQPACELSVKTGAGWDAACNALAARVAELMDGGASVQVTRQRHREALRDCSDCLGAFQAAAQQGVPELAAEHVRLAARALGRITGRVDVEELLDVVFKDFCIGK